MIEDMPGVWFEFQEMSAEDHGRVIPASIGRAVFFDLTGPKIPPVPDAQAYVEMVAQQRYDLRLQVRDLPDSVRIPWLNQFKKILHEGLTRAQLESLHEERNRMDRSEEHTSELQSIMRISYAVFCLKKKQSTRHTQAQRDN